MSKFRRLNYQQNCDKQADGLRVGQFKLFVCKDMVLQICQKWSVLKLIVNRELRSLGILSGLTKITNSICFQHNCIQFLLFLGRDGCSTFDVP